MPSRVQKECYNGPTNYSTAGWIRVDDSSLDSWDEVEAHSFGRFDKTSFESISNYRCNF